MLWETAENNIEFIHQFANLENLMQITLEIEISGERAVYFTCLKVILV